jgi:hypothetical protein
MSATKTAGGVGRIDHGRSDVQIELRSLLRGSQEVVEHLAPHLITKADRVSARLGYRRADKQAAGR